MTLSRFSFWGPVSRFGVTLAAITFVIDQGHKWLMIKGFAFKEGTLIPVTSFLDLLLVWNKGISYGLFPQNTALGRSLLLGIALVTCLVLFAWLAAAHSRRVAIALGLLIGGAAGNALDRIVHGAVADFFSLHAFGFYWYVFNLADVAIVTGVGLLLYDSLKPQAKIRKQT